MLIISSSPACMWGGGEAFFNNSLTFSQYLQSSGMSMEQAAQGRAGAKAQPPHQSPLEAAMVNLECFLRDANFDFWVWYCRLLVTIGSWMDLYSTPKKSSPVVGMVHTRRYNHSGSNSNNICGAFIHTGQHDHVCILCNPGKRMANDINSESLFPPSSILRACSIVSTGNLLCAFFFHFIIIFSTAKLRYQQRCLSGHKTKISQNCCWFLLLPLPLSLHLLLFLLQIMSFLYLFTLRSDFKM